ncbi:MAG: 4Fe-4S binding protein, partial [Candidatus Omnitrophica bacterium]|nr:4Fe-4S binding protein [Candidatus Omnitrophota bacterium]
QYGCMGFGDCTAVCPFDALHMKDGLPAVDTAKCTGCGKCKDACPRKIIEIAEKRSAGIFYVACSSLDNALRVREICGVGCIACGICERISPEKFFKVENNLSRRDPSKQGTDAQVDEIRKISGKCPTKVIKSLE